MECEVTLCEFIQLDIVAKEVAVNLQRFNGMNDKSRRSLFCQERVISDCRSDIHEAAVRRHRSNQSQENILFLTFMDVADAVAFPLFRDEVIFKDPHAILEAMNLPDHGTLSRRRIDHIIVRWIMTVANESNG